MVSLGEEYHVGTENILLKFYLRNYEETIFNFSQDQEKEA